MDRYYKTNLGHGIGTSPQYSITNQEYENKVHKLENEYEEEKVKIDIEFELGIKELEKAGVKFDKENVIFVTRTSDNQLVWLELGNDYSGLKHILKRHANDFNKKLVIKENDIISLIEDIIKRGKIEYSRVFKSKGIDKIEKLYKYENKYYFIVALGTNGYIVTVHPENKKDAIKWIRRYKNGEN
jgi:hypothetical protein